MTEQDLLKMKKDIDEAKIKQAELAGAEKQLLKRLSDEFQINTPDEAKKLLENYKIQLLTIDGEITKLSEEIEKLLNDE